MQNCKTCDIEKEYGEFYKDTKNKSNFSKICRVCEKARTKVYYLDNRESLLKKRAEYRKNNKEKIDKYQKSYGAENRHVGRKSNEKWKTKPENKKKMAKLSKDWAARNIDKRRYMSSRRRASKLKATPEWADMKKIAGVYTGAKMLEDLLGLKFHVDHIIPLQGENVCGLHIWENLQVLEASLNIKKGNKL